MNRNKKEQYENKNENAKQMIWNKNKIIRRN
jgi:hypothetical protein